MSFEFFIAKRIYSEQAADGERFSRPAVRIAQMGVAIGLAVMLISLAVVLGFKREVSAKVTGFGSHVQVVSLTQNQRYEILPVLTTDSLVQALERMRGIRHVQKYALKLGMLKTEEDFCGLNFKGIGEEYDKAFLEGCLVEGEMPDFSSEEASGKIVISKKVATELGVKAGDRIFAYFMGDESMRARRFTIAGIYESHMSEYDENVAVTDIYTVRKLNGWEKEQSSGLEIAVRDFDKVDEIARQLQFLCKSPDRNGVIYGVFSIKDIAQHTFAWLDVLDMNVMMIIILMMLVGAFTIVSGLLIIMLERISMIGTLKVLGAANAAVRKVFNSFSFMLVGKGLLWGNAAGLLLCWLQQEMKLMSLDASVYYVDAVPIAFDWLLILAVNAATALVAACVVCGGSHLISIGKPSETIRFE